eukprot:scaffold46291_cov67-Phaeocystis_antarctica.AAC.2
MSGMHDAAEPGLLWAAVTRNKTVLAECGVITSAEDSRAGAVVELAQQILKKKPTAGWEFARARGLSAVKFHVHDVHETAAGTEVVWAISCVHEAGFDGTLAKGFLEKITLLTEPLRRTPEWRTGRVLCAQASFAPVLQQRLEQANATGRTAMVSQQVDEVKSVMHENIELILRRGEDLETLEARGEGLSQLAQHFKAQATKAKRFQMWQHAKFGAVVGGAVTVGVAVLVLPILL